MKFGIIVFPGSNCDHDAMHASTVNAGADAEFIWHKENQLPSGLDCIILPGGFSYGDYLRSGAIARFSPVMKEVIKFAHGGGYVMGICNGFQILTESRLLPGTLLKNTALHFLCKDVHIRTENNETAFTGSLAKGDVLRIPIAHFEGNYYADEDVLKSLQDNNQIVFTYCDKDGKPSPGANPNGSLLDIAGIINDKGNVLGMMPHPERYCDEALGCNDGLAVFNSLLKHFK